MKKNLYTVFALLLLFVFSCSKSSNTDIDSDTNQPIDKPASFKAIGDSANDLLSNDKFDKLKLEIGYVKDFRPTATTIADLVEFLKEYTFKEIIEITYLELDSPNKETLKLQEVADLETKNRTAFNQGKTLAVYIYFSDAPSDDDEPEADLVTLGAVYRNTSMVIYESTIINLAAKSTRISTGTVETATLLHEFGHLFGLVNIGSDMVNPHEGVTTDEVSGEEIGNKHCNQDGCLMRAELEFGAGMRKMITAKNGQVPDYDTECLLDLKANGGR
ncbi:hypothetical protein [Cellulophaga sp. Hel_I_12]|uniref:hypothetical protein n=1 Tax=Cellulophaga sp. Hel_I_12 TaxID=1249972 RepID=UPI0006489D8A|nr:hypothetical protein [Cellulophaga sp. Hel_I_12]